MKLYELVRLRNLLDESIALEELRVDTGTLLQRIDSLSSVAAGVAQDYAEPVKQIRNYYANILTMLDSPPKALAELRALIEEQIAILTLGWDKRGYTINGFFATNSTDAVTERNDRIMSIGTDTRKIVTNRIAAYSSWQYPGLEIGPGDGVWTSSLVASDPLYLIDNHKEFLDVTVSRFSEDYQRRLRPYIIDRTTNDITELPEGQIGFAFAWNVFNYFPQFELRAYLTQVYELLRPGGVLLFSYNNCDNPTQAGFAEDGWMSWMPKTLLATLVADIGFEVIAFFDPEVNVSWVEVKKPGTLATMKAHQVLGEIKTI